MAKVHNTVFISHRNTNKSHALLLYKSLEERGYDCFLDVNSMESGEFPDQLEGNIKARAHFVVILTPSALEYGYRPDSWIRREIELAVQSKRNIVPLIFDGFNFNKAREEGWLAGDALPKLPNYQSVEVPWHLFDAAIDLLCGDRYLGKPLNVTIHSLDTEEQLQTEQQKEELSEKPIPTETELTAEEYFERGNLADDEKHYDAAIEFYTLAIELKPDLAEAYNNRGNAYGEKGELDAAIANHTQAIVLKPDLADAYYNRGNAYGQKGDLDAAIADFTKAIALKLDLADAYYNRGVAYGQKGDLDAAFADYEKAIELNPGDTKAYTNRGEILFALRRFEYALYDFHNAIEYDGNNQMAIAGLAITHYALGATVDAKSLWRKLLAQDVRYSDANWVGQEMNWPESMIEEARKLIARLNDDDA